MNNSILKKIVHLAYQIAGCSLSTPENPKPHLDKLGINPNKNQTLLLAHYTPISLQSLPKCKLVLIQQTAPPPKPMNMIL
jgi:hypothetical protein